MNLYNRAEKYSKYYFWDFGMILTEKALSNKEMGNLVNEIAIKCITKKELTKIKVSEVIKIIENEARLSLKEKEALLSNLPIIEVMRLERHNIIIEDNNREAMEKYLIKKGFYPVFLANTFKWEL